IVVAIAVSAYSAFASPNTNTAATLNTGRGNGQGGNGGNGTGTSVLDIPASDLSAEETASLLFMREEEKLARDVYNFLYTTWGQPTFQNIASSEQTHMDEIKLLLDRYGLADPALDPGQFTDANLQALYTQLTTQGALSLGDALKVGAAIEEIDILDLQTRLAQTDNADLQQVFTSLMNGSYNHLKSFTSVLLTQTGETYQPQYLTAEQYQTIITSTTGTGGQGNGGGQGTGTGGQGNGGQGNGGQGNGGQGNGQSTTTGMPQANIAGATTVHGTVVSFDQMGLSLTLDDGTALYVQLGNSRYSQTIGFAPQVGEAVTVYGFPGDLGAYSAITVTLDSTGQVYTFRSETGQPLWSGGNGKGNGGNH
ncbi:MAG TPA: DUF2202 domain-containing protein, partial [Anaerolineales bacterium]|nr:DUF2202 domain-containing protein [Anaerolineales bacterium]